jgi:hypothetical protein
MNANVTPRPKRPRPAVAIAVALALVAAVVVLVETSKPVPVNFATVPPSPEARAQVIRHAAANACGAEHWKECLDRLDEAREMDPQGDSAGNVQALRTTATARLSHP